MPLAQAPQDVSQAAQARGFGPLMSRRELANARNRFLLWLGASVACLVLLILTANVFQVSVFSAWYSVVRFVGLFFCFGMVIALCAAGLW
jgi:hypothetical protein